MKVSGNQIWFGTVVDRQHLLRMKWILCCSGVAFAAVIVLNCVRYTPCFDELGAFMAGMAHWELARFDIYKVNPPLPRMVAGIPFLFTGSVYDWRFVPTDAQGMIDHLLLGSHFLSQMGREGLAYLAIARAAMLPIWGLGVVGVLCLARQIGLPLESRLASAMMWMVCPTMLGHSSIVGNDVAGAVAGLFVADTFLRWVRSPSYGRLLAASAAVAVAICCKATWVWLLPLFPCLVLAIHITHLRDRGWKRVLFGSVGVSILALAAILFIINAIYCFQGALVPMREIVAASLHIDGPVYHLASRLAIAEPLLQYDIPCVLPRDLVLGIDLQKKGMEQPSLCYFWGNWTRGGFWYYYLACFLLKTPVGMIGIVVAGVLFALRNAKRFPPLAVCVAIAAILGVLISSQVSLNKHYRYFLPVLPMLFVVSGSLWTIRSVAIRRLLWVAIVISAVESLWCAPHNMSFFNVAVGGPMRGDAYLLNSNISWGQDIGRLVEWQQQNGSSKPLYAALHACFEPADVGLVYEFPEFLAENAANSIHLRPGWYAVDVNMLRGYPFPSPNGHGGRSRLAENVRQELSRRTPDARIGYSIFLYDVH